MTHALARSEPAAEPASPAPIGGERLAQGIVCGPWALAFPFDWARTIVEDFDLAQVPKAPPWLIGAANVEGDIIPVIDLALYVSPGAAPDTRSGQRRLLVGGSTADGAEDALAIIFSRLPQQLRYTPQSLSDIAGLPARLQDLCAAYAQDGSGQMYLEIHCGRLMDALALELSVL